MKRAIGYIFLLSLLFSPFLKMTHPIKQIGGALILPLGLGCGNGTDSQTEDADQDGVADLQDNCPNHFNPSQTDENNNGVGEVCEPFDPRDGQIACEFPPCSLGQECFEFLDQCPGAETELEFTGQAVICCDNACAVVSTESFECPAGTCADSTPHCINDEDCPVVVPGGCFQGCCIGAAPECSVAPCNPENPECPPGFSCEFDEVLGQTCCIDTGASSCGNGMCEPDLGECDGCPDCTSEDCPETGCGEVPTCDPADSGAKQSCGDYFKDILDLPPGQACCEPTGCCGHSNLGGCGP